MPNLQPDACCEPGGPPDGYVSAADPTCYCPLDEVIDTVRKKYTMQIIALLGADKPLRYGELKDRLDAPSDATLSDRLATLGDAGLVARHSYDEIPPRVEYSLTSTGCELEDHLAPLLEWAAQNETD